MSAKYLVTNDEDYLWSAFVFPLAGLLFDFFDGKVARWRNESSMIGQELDSLADLVRSRFRILHVKLRLTTFLPSVYLRPVPPHQFSWLLASTDHAGSDGPVYV